MAPLGMALLEALLRGGVLLLLTLAVVSLLRAIPASWRHAVLCTALLGQGLLLVLAVGAPSLRLRLLPAPWRVVELNAPLALSESGPIVGEAALRETRDPAGAPSDARRLASLEADGGSLTHLGTLLAFLWMGGALLLLTRLATNSAALRRLRRDGCVPTDANWSTLVADCAAAVGYPRPVTVLLGDAVGVPCVTGLRDPAVLLPSSAVHWSELRRRAVVLHELAHLVRRDILTTRMVEIVAAVCWLSPLVHIASRRTADERERAADDAVLRAGLHPSAYVLELVGLLSRPPHPGASQVGLGMRGSRVGRRLRAVLESGRARSGIRPRTFGLLVGAGVCTLVPAGLLAPADHAAGTRVSTWPAPAAVPPAMPRCPYTGGRHVDRVRRLPDGRAEWQVSWTGEDCGVAVAAVGTPAGARRLAELTPRSPADTVVVTAHLGRRPLRFVAVAGQALPPWWHEFALELDRHTAFAIDERLPGLTRSGGLDSVLADVARMHGPHAAATYLAGAVRLMQPSAAALARVLAAARTPVVNDAALGDLLAAVAQSPEAEGPAADPALAGEYRRTAALLRSRAARERAAAEAPARSP